jgi:hypothetical protein
MKFPSSIVRFVASPKANIISSGAILIVNTAYNNARIYQYCHENEWQEIIVLEYVIPCLTLICLGITFWSLQGCFCYFELRIKTIILYAYFHFVIVVVVVVVIVVVQYMGIMCMYYHLTNQRIISCYPPIWLVVERGGAVLHWAKECKKHVHYSTPFDLGCETSTWKVYMLVKINCLTQFANKKLKLWEWQVKPNWHLSTLWWRGLLVF